MSTLDEQKRMLLPFLQRADEIEKHDPKVAYYCRMYAVEQGLAIPKHERDPKITGLLDALLIKLEATKAAANLAGQDADKVYLEEFALKVFSRADRVDRAGLADKKTAVTFLAAFYFFEILAQFGELAIDIAEKQRYAAWKAADINKAVREGRAPTPGGPADVDPSAGVDGEGDVGAVHQHYPTDTVVPPPPLPPLPPAVDTDATEDTTHYHAPPPSSLPTAYGSTTHTNQESNDNNNNNDDEDEDEDDDFGLPEPPTSLHQAPSITATTTTQLPPMTPGTRVLFMDDVYDATGEGGRPMRGTVARVDGNVLHVALADRIVPALREQLVYEVLVGDEVQYIRDDAAGEECTVEAADVQHWPPSYTVLMRSGSVRDVSGEYLVPASTAQHTSPAATANTYPNIDNTPPVHKTTPPPVHTPAPPPPQATPTPPAPTPVTPPPQTTPPPPPPPVLPPAAVPGYQPSLAVITEAHKQAKYAVSSLSFEDVPTAIKHLTQALKLLTNPQP